MLEIETALKIQVMTFCSLEPYPKKQVQSKQFGTQYIKYLLYDH